MEERVGAGYYSIKGCWFVVVIPASGHLWERVATSVETCFVCIISFVIFVVSHFGFDGRTLVLIAPVPDYCLSFTLPLPLCAGD